MCHCRHPPACGMNPELFTCKVLAPSRHVRTVPPCPSDVLVCGGHAGGGGSKAQATAIVVLSVLVGLTLAALLAVTLAAHGGGAAIMKTLSKVAAMHDYSCKCWLCI